MSRSVAEIDVAAIAHNVTLLRQRVGPQRQLCAVVKADGYGHGALTVATAALGAGATWLAVAQPAEGATLRAGGIPAPVLLLSEPLDDTEVAQVVANDLRVTVYSAEVIDALGATGAPLRLHVKVDTGMGRVGAAPADVLGLIRRIQGHPTLRLEGLWTHLAQADEPDQPFTGEQLTRFAAVRQELAGVGIEVPVVHAANSAASLSRPDSWFNLVRAGIALYGVVPSEQVSRAEPVSAGLRAALRWRSTVSLVKQLPAGVGVSYGQRHRLVRDTTVATVPVGYADGLWRRWGAAGGVVLIGGARCPILPPVTMDQVLVDAGPAGTVSRGDEVVLLGTQGAAGIDATEIARACDTIAYEVLTAIGPRVTRQPLSARV
ncbi:MAG: alanine racemase [Acidimicrobiales bacterium]